MLHNLRVDERLMKVEEFELEEADEEPNNQYVPAQLIQSRRNYIVNNFSQ